MIQMIQFLNFFGVKSVVDKESDFTYSCDSWTKCYSSQTNIFYILNFLSADSVFEKDFSICSNSGY